MTCAQAKPLFSPYLDGAVTGKQMRDISGHRNPAARAGRRFVSLRRRQRFPQSQMGPLQARQILALNLGWQFHKRLLDPVAGIWMASRCGSRIHSTFSWSRPLQA